MRNIDRYEYAMKLLPTKPITYWSGTFLDYNDINYLPLIGLSILQTTRESMLKLIYRANHFQMCYQNIFNSAYNLRNALHITPRSYSRFAHSQWEAVTTSLISWVEA